jgi:hypothetical protein
MAQWLEANDLDRKSVVAMAVSLVALGKDLMGPADRDALLLLLERLVADPHIDIPLLPMLIRFVAGSVGPQEVLLGLPAESRPQLELFFEKTASARPLVARRWEFRKSV